MEKYYKENKENIPEPENDESAKFFRLDEPWICQFCDLKTTSAGKVIAKCLKVSKFKIFGHLLKILIFD